MSDWPSLGFLCILFQIKDEQVREAYSSYGSSFPSLQRKDRRLGAALIHLEQQNLLVEVMKYSS
jgi:CRISPR/Cas system CMR-associated protein Cmr5 small subunit